ncbi:hypothetical protein ACFY2R_28395 [Micromonospora olivasterospora]|uniref:hypothetical protein n=1 Tax=Micromonospora olivasterospora TaxID=1880 RepID=UPI001FEA7423|nr:hypothetical protein [Micromonospora olivasterospora]
MAAAPDPDRIVSTDARATDARATDAPSSAVGAGSGVGTDAIFGGDERMPVNPTTTFPASGTVLTANLVYVQHDATGGQDGSPIFYRPDPEDLCPLPPRPPWPWPWALRTVLGILSSGPSGGGPGAVNNIGTRITRAAYNNLMLWR